jgi:GTP-binding protein
MDSDEMVMNLLDQTAVSYGLVLTKGDELKPSEQAPALEAARAAAAKHTAALAQVQLTSSFKGDGIAGLRTHLASFAQ